MTDKRLGKRCRKRLQVRFGKDHPNSIAFTDDISLTGLFLHTGLAFPPKTRLQIEITVADGDRIRFEGIVMWGKKVPPAVVHRIKAGMGIRITRFLGGKDAYLRLQQNLPRSHAFGPVPD